MINSGDSIGSQTCDLLACSAVPEPTAPPVPLNLRHYHNICTEILKEGMKNLRIVDIHTEN